MTHLFQDYAEGNAMLAIINKAKSSSSLVEAMTCLMMEERVIEIWVVFISEIEANCSVVFGI